MRRIALLTVAALMTIATLLSAALSGETTDPARGARRERALRVLAARLQPSRSYTREGGAACFDVEHDALGLLARLELAHMGLPGGASPAAAEPWARQVAGAIAHLQGRAGAQGPCARPHSGGSAVHHAAAGLAYALHRHGGGWSAVTLEAIRAAVAESAWGPSDRLHNKAISIPAAELLVGEALAAPELSRRGGESLQRIFERVRSHGGFEMNAPLYTAQHFPALVYLQALADPIHHARARILLEFELLVQAHLYLPGGGLGAPQSRDYAGGTADHGERGLDPLLWLLVGDPEVDVDLTRAGGALAVAASDYVLPAAVRAIFLDKPAGYSFWTRADARQGPLRTPRALYRVGPRRVHAIPWQAVVLPGGRTMLGVAYGWHQTALGVSSGLYTRMSDGRFVILYQHQPMVRGDTDDLRFPLKGAGLDDDPGDFVSELYDFEWLVHGRSAIALWNPAGHGAAVRTHRDTRVHLPEYGALGGESMRAGAWRVARIDDDYVGYRPLGTIVADESRDGGSWRYLRLAGPSGGIFELATRADHPTLAEFAASLEKRHVAFTRNPLVAEFDARSSTGTLVRLRLEHDPERRVVGGTEAPTAALDHGLMESPWVRWDAASQRMTVAREGFPVLVYDWAQSRVGEDRAPLAAP